MPAGEVVPQLRRRRDQIQAVRQRVTAVGTATFLQHTPAPSADDLALTTVNPVVPCLAQAVPGIGGTHC
jgi:hypothetical protein